MDYRAILGLHIIGPILKLYQWIKKLLAKKDFFQKAGYQGTTNDKGLSLFIPAARHSASPGWKREISHRYYPALSITRTTHRFLFSLELGVFKLLASTIEFCLDTEKHFYIYKLKSYIRANPNRSSS